MTIINDKLISFLSEHPEYLHKLHWRDFEKLLDELFSAQGYQTILGPGGGDGGIDLRLLQRSDISDLLIVVQAKKYAPKNKIDLQPVQAIYGAAMSSDVNASGSLIVSTSDFLPSAKEFAEKNRYRLKLAGPDKIQRWLKDYVTRN